MMGYMKSKDLMISDLEAAIALLKKRISDLSIEIEWSSNTKAKELIRTHIATAGDLFTSLMEVIKEHYIYEWNKSGPLRQSDGDYPRGAKKR